MVFPCVVDLVENGIMTERFTTQDRMPSRQDVTQYLATWFSYIEVAADDCQDWMIEYCTSVLSSISSSSKSKIRHSTISNIKYVYRSGVEFDCKCSENVFKANCSSDCKVYDEMIHKGEKASTSRVNELNATKVEYDTKRTLSTKEQYREQFLKAKDVIRHHLRSNVTRKEIVKILNDQGFKTRTGKMWSVSILGCEVKEIENKITR